MSWNPRTGDSNEEEAKIYSSDDFRMRIMKVMGCEKKYCHDWTRCPFAHPGEKATRRDPKDGTYTGIACPDMRRDQRCPRGDYCPYAHNVFEYWLHPTRYRTAICRDGDHCHRNVCFFAHNPRELRTNVERPYVGPEQLLAASQHAAHDPATLAAYNAAGLASAGRNVFSGIDDKDVGRTLEEFQQSGGLSSLPVPVTSMQRAETMNAFSTMIRGDAEGNNLISGTEGENYLPPSSSGALSTSSSKGFGLKSQGLGSARGSSAPAQQHSLRRGAHIHSHGSEQNLVNAKAQLGIDTPRTPLDHQALFSTGSTISDRFRLHSVDSVGFDRNMDFANRQRMRRQMGRRQSNSSFAPSALSSQLASALYSGNSPHPSTLFTAGSSHPSNTIFTGGSSHFSNHALMSGASSNDRLGLQSQPSHMQPGLLQGGLPQSVQDDWSQQQHQLLAIQQFRLQQHQQQQAAYDQHMNAQLHHNLQRNLSMQARAPEMPLGVPGADTAETGFDLRFGGLGENQGLLAQPPHEITRDSINSYHRLTQLYSIPDESLMHSASFQPQNSGRAADASLLHALQAQSLRDAAAASSDALARRSLEESLHTTAGPSRRVSMESLRNVEGLMLGNRALPLDMDLAQSLRLSETIPQSRSQ